MPRNYDYENWLSVRSQNVCSQQRDQSQAATPIRRNPSRAPYALPGAFHQTQNKDNAARIEAKGRGANSDGMCSRNRGSAFSSPLKKLYGRGSTVERFFAAVD
jgi:hypothetical protein